VNRLKIGLNNYKAIYLKENDRYLHSLLIGQTGAGKSSLLLSFWEQDCLYPNSAKILIDPSGFLALEAYSLTR
jgi:hypothetical protein